MTDFRTLHEDGVLKDILDYISGKGDPSKSMTASIINGMRGFVNGTKNTNKFAINSNIARSSKALTAVFPVIVSKAVEIDKAVMISKAVERKCVAMLQMLFAAFQICDARDAKTYLQNFHGNISSSLDLSDMDIDDFLDYTEGLESTQEFAVNIQGAIDAINEDVRNHIHHTLDDGLNPPISDIIVHELALDPYRDRNAIPRITTTRRETYSIGPNGERLTRNGQTGSDITMDRQGTSDIQMLTAQDWKSNADALSKSILDGDIKKANEAQPSMMIINFVSTNNNYKIQNSCVIGVKAVIHYVDPQDVVNRVILKKADSRGLFNLIRATTREISFFKDFLFAVNRAKVDAIAKSGKGSTDKIWKLLELRADRLRGAKVSRQNQAGSAAITTLVISRAEVDYIKQFHRIDLNKPGTLAGILRGYNMMAAAIIDDVNERVDFLWDDGTGSFESLSFMSLEREDNGSMYKKVINLAMKGR